MKWFGKSAVPNPEVVYGLVVATYSLQYSCWTFEYEGVKYVAYGHRLYLIDHSKLEIIHNDVIALMPEMRERLRVGWQEYDVTINDGEKYFIDVSGFRSSGEFGICWTDGANWGDMSIEFTIKNHEIIDESWGD